MVLKVRVLMGNGPAPQAIKLLDKSTVGQDINGPHWERTRTNSSLLPELPQ